jgi:hypothetical protein
LTTEEDKVIPLVDEKGIVHAYRDARSAAAFLGIQSRTFYRRNYTRLGREVEGYSKRLYDEADLLPLKAQLQRAKSKKG